MLLFLNFWTDFVKIWYTDLLLYRLKKKVLMFLVMLPSLIMLSYKMQIWSKSHKMLLFLNFLTDFV